VVRVNRIKQPTAAAASTTTKAAAPAPAAATTKAAATAAATELVKGGHATSSETLRWGANTPKGMPLNYILKKPRPIDSRLRPDYLADFLPEKIWRTFYNEVLPDFLAHSVK
jgi:hypothetical protein